MWSFIMAFVFDLECPGEVNLRSCIFQRAVTWQIRPNLLLMMDRKSYMPFHSVLLTLTYSDVERLNQGHAYFLGL